MCSYVLFRTPPNKLTLKVDALAVEEFSSKDSKKEKKDPVILPIRKASNKEDIPDFTPIFRVLNIDKPVENEIEFK